MSAEERFDTAADLYQRMADDARLNLVPARLLDIQSADDLAELRETINKAIEARTVTARDLARRTDFKPAAIAAFLGDKWRGSAGAQATLASALGRCLNAVLRERAAAADSPLTGFVPIRLAEAIIALVGYATKRRKIAAFLAPAGMGKTTTLRAIHAETPGAVFITVNANTGTAHEFGRAWCAALGVPVSGTAAERQRRLVRALAGSSRLQLIDEAHQLCVASLNLVREVWDAAGVPVILAGTPVMYQTMTVRRAGSLPAELMDSFYRRIVFRDFSESLEGRTPGGEAEPLVSLADVRAMYTNRGVRLAPDAEDFLCRLANTPGAGGIGTCTEIVTTISDLFPGQVITAARLKDALRLRLGTQEAGFQVERVESYPARPVAASA